MAQENLKIERFTVENVIPTKTLEAMSTHQLVQHVQKLEEHLLQFDYALDIMMQNIQSVKKGAAKQEAENAMKKADEERE